ncbi:MAG: hypothetical protein KGJ49_00035 [Alphaproteobacteria bacterium]|nr:hypothetical protein [Alphaproteobacteria bacterium]
MLGNECAIAQTDSGSPFLRPEGTQSSAASNAPCDYTFPSKVPVKCWAGQKFMVLPIDPQLRSYGYQEFTKGDSVIDHATYDELAGKVVTVTDVQWRLIAPALPDSGGWVVTFQDDASGVTYHTRAVTLPNDPPDDATVDHLALVRDLQGARQMYLGKTFWMKSGWLPEFNGNGSISFSNTVTYKKFVPTTISDVLASYDPHEPVRVVIKNDAGQEGYFDMAVSPTNRSAKWPGKVGEAAFAEVMASTDPKLAHKWPAKVWDAIENQKVFMGMTMEQARLSWGEPRDVNRTVVGDHVHEQWVYGEAHNYLYFEDGRLTGIQN